MSALRRGSSGRVELDRIGATVRGPSFVGVLPS